MNSINKMIGAKEGCLQAAQTAKEHQMPLVYYSFSAAPNLDYYFRQHDMQIKEIDSKIVFEVKQPDGSEFDKVLQINSDRLLPYITKAIQELNNKIDNLRLEKNI